MTDPVFQAPGIPTPNFEQKPQNTPVSPVSQETVQPTQTQPSVVPQPTVQPVNAQPVQQTPVATQTTNEQVEVQPQATPAAAPMDNLKEKLGSIDVGQLRQKIQSYLWYTLGGCFLLGMMFGCSMGGGDSQPAQTKSSGMEKYIIANPDIPKKVKSCGMVNIQTDACRYYVLNSNTYDKRAEDFFKLVQDQVKKDEYYIRQVNPIYAQQPIPPGHFAEILVPATK